MLHAGRKIHNDRLGEENDRFKSEYDLMRSDEWKIRKYPCTGRSGVSDDDDAWGYRGEDRGRIFAGASRLPCGYPDFLQRTMRLPGRMAF